MTKNIDLLNLMEEVRSSSLPADWSEQRSRGERKRAFSRSSFEDDLYEKRKEIGNANFLKKIYNYHRHNSTVKVERGVSERQVSVFLHYIFKDIITDYGWPRVLKSFKDFKQGAFYGLIQHYEKDFLSNSGKPAEVIQSETIHMELLQAAIKAKTAYENTHRDMAVTKNENERLKEIIKKQEESSQSIREHIAILERLIKDNPENTKHLLKELNQIKLLY